MATKPVHEKLYLKPGKRFAVVRPPEDWVSLLGGLPEGVVQVEDDARAEVVLAFIDDRAQLDAHFADLRDRLAEGGALWIAYHKGTSPVDTDINRDVIASLASSIGLKPVAIISIDDDWSALRLKRV